MARTKSTSDLGWAVLTRIRKTKPFMLGSLTTTKRRCGNPKCRCAREGPIHEVTLLTWKDGNKTRTLYVPRRLVGQVQRWIVEARRLRELMAEMSEAQREFLTKLSKTRSS
jgi:hypothetical protein